jgi:hypothetical protein
VLEVLIYYVPWLDHIADAVAAPVAVIAGILLAAAPLVELPPMVRWSIAVIGGGGASGLFQSLSVLLRLKSTAFTAGIGNPVVSTLELVVSAVVAVLAIILPLVCLVVVVLLLLAILRLRRRLVARDTQ